MDTSRVGAQTVDLLSRITGQKLSQRDLKPLVIFLANLVTLLLGVIFVDGTVAESEKQRLLTILYRFSLPESDVRRLTHLMIKGVKENEVYQKVNDLLTLAAPLSESERLLLISFGYEISAVDGEMDSREKKYLQIVAKEIGINPQHLAVLEAGVTHHGSVELTAVNEVYFLLDPSRFQELETIFVKAASDILKALPVKPEHKTTKQHKKLNYQELKKFQSYHKQLDNYFYQIFQIIEECQKQEFLHYTLIEEASEVSKKLQSQRFRLEGIDYLDANIADEIEAIQGDFKRLDQQVSTNFSEQMNLSITGINDEFMGLGGIGGGLGIGGALAAGLIVFTGLGFIAVVVASVAAAIASSFGLGMLDLDGLKDQIKLTVLEVGFEKLDESIDKLSEKLEKIISTVFDSRIESASRVIEQAIALYENLLEQQEKAHQETLEQREAEKELIYQKRQELEQVQNDLEVLLSQSTVQ